MQTISAKIGLTSGVSELARQQNRQTFHNGKEGIAASWRSTRKDPWTVGFWIRPWPLRPGRRRWKA